MATSQAGEETHRRFFHLADFFGPQTLEKRGCWRRTYGFSTATGGQRPLFGARGQSEDGAVWKSGKADTGVQNLQIDKSEG